MARNDSGISADRKGFGTRSMFVGRKMFAVLHTTGELVVKLPPDRVKALIDSKMGRGWHPGNGAPLKDYVAISFDHERDWCALALEAREYMGGKA
ncbi:MAG: MmcQ/YjbR family DNA-binding protein [Thermoplasmata archaeon]|nr:MmcQ/YjbR family DNA-binding protein [Thermoplasmata archaeon]